MWVLFYVFIMNVCVLITYSNVASLGLSFISALGEFLQTSNFFYGLENL